MREMKDSVVAWIGDIPVNWDVQKVKNAFYRSKEEAHIEDPVVLSLARSGVKVRDISNNEGQLAESYYNYNPVVPGDLLLNPMDLYSGANCGVSKVEGVISPAYINLRTRGEYCPTYYDYYFKTQYWAMALFAHGKGVSFDNRWTLSPNDLFNYAIPVPNFDEQKRIAEFLDYQCAEIDAVIEKTKATIEEYKKLKQSVITEAVTKGIRGDRPMKDSGIEWIGEIPADWSISKIKIGVSKVGSGKTPLGGAESYAEEGVLFLRSQNVYDTGLLLDSPTYITEAVDEEMKSTRVYPRDVLLNITGGSIGRCCIFPNECVRANVNQHVSIIRVIESVFLPEYMHYYWLSSLGHTAIDLYQTGGNREGMSADAIKNSPITIIPIEEQNEIVAYLDNKCAEIDTLISKKTALLGEMEMYKKSVIYEYVTGKKEVV